MPRTPQEGSIDQAVARLLSEPEDTNASATPEVEPEEQHEAPDEAELEETLEYEESETEDEEEEYEEQEEAPEYEDAEEESEYEEESEGEETEGEGEEPTVYTVKIDGEDYEVGLDELTSGYQRQSDYTKKTQALSEERKQLETKLSEVQAVQEDFMSKAQMANELLNRDLAKYASVDWDTLKTENPTEFLSKQIEVQDIKKAQDELQATFRQVQESQMQAQQEAWNAMLAAEKPKVLAAFPEWVDNDKAQSHYQKLMEYGSSNGFQEQELQSIVSARDLTILDKARKYDEIQKTKAGIKKKKAAPIKKVVKPKGVAPKSAGSKKRVQQSRDKLRASGSLQDAAALLLERRQAGQKRFNK